MSHELAAAQAPVARLVWCATAELHTTCRRLAEHQIERMDMAAVAIDHAADIAVGLGILGDLGLGDHLQPVMPMLHPVGPDVRHLLHLPQQLLIVVIILRHERMKPEERSWIVLHPRTGCFWNSVNYAFVPSNLQDVSQGRHQGIAG